MNSVFLLSIIWLMLPSLSSSYTGNEADELPSPRKEPVGAEDPKSRSSSPVPRDGQPATDLSALSFVFASHAAGRASGDRGQTSERKPATKSLLSSALAQSGSTRRSPEQEQAQTETTEAPRAPESDAP